MSNPQVETGNSTVNLTDPKPKAGLKCSDIILIAINCVNHILILLVTGYIMYLTVKPFNTFDRHVLFCTIGYVLLMAEATVILAGENVWTICLTRRGNSHLHWILQLIGAASIIYGVYVVYDVKRVHFNSQHGITGLTSVVLMIVSIVLGVPALFAARLRRTVKPVVSKFIHNLLGISCFVVGIASQIMGYELNWMKARVPDEVILLFIIATVMVTVFSLIGALRSLWGQLLGLCR
ncbi:cytochrome b561 domain-containing protein 2 [Cephus cinctus]|uniref:ascorbate ferrireductase (transmembrane) n=1 Tax=Cephus cinctus TaxID=211228 RepID=A0AAJ7C678_CEPCN|nr:cytochrome b561 domain-containing protein 2 [Cephus cinctus]